MNLKMFKLKKNLMRNYINKIKNYIIFFFIKIKLILFKDNNNL